MNMTIRFALYLVFLVCSIRAWSFVSFLHADWKITTDITVLLSVTAFFGTSTRHKWVFAKPVLLIMLSMLLSIIPAYMLHGQSFTQSLIVQRFTLLWVVYFFIGKVEFGRTSVEKALVFMGTIWALITLIQQVTYPHFAFSSREVVEYRFGVYRYMLLGVEYAIFALMYLLFSCGPINHSSRNRKLLVLVLVAGLLFFGTRQYFVAAFISVIISFAAKKIVSRSWLRLLSILAISAVVASVIAGSSVAAASRGEINDDENVRYDAFRFYATEYSEATLAKLLGNGRYHVDSRYGKEMMGYEASGRWQSDIGIFGAYSIYGGVFVLVSLCVLLYGVMHSYRTRDFSLFGVYVYMILEGFSSPILCYYENIPFIASVFYLSDCGKKDE